MKHVPPGTKTFFGSGRLVPFVALRIICRVKWYGKHASLKAVTDEYVLLQIKGGAGGFPTSKHQRGPKEEVRDEIAKTSQYIQG
ncbi:hypothetical protein PG988_008059 [Apiospora saccharicola]